MPSVNRVEAQYIQSPRPKKIQLQSKCKILFVYLTRYWLLLTYFKTVMITNTSRSTKYQKTVQFLCGGLIMKGKTQC